MSLHVISHIYLDETFEEIYTYRSTTFLCLFQIGESFNTIIHKYVNNITSDHSCYLPKKKSKNEIKEKQRPFLHTPYTRK